jgi:CBS domain-containing protein
MVMIVADILRHKGRQIFHVSPDTDLAEVARRLEEHRIGAVLVLDDWNQLAGIVSERDIVRALRRHGADTLKMTAAQVMTRSVTTVSPRATVAEAMSLMTEGRFRHIPVVENGQLVGVISIGDVVKARIVEQAEENESLRAYIAGAA